MNKFWRFTFTLLVFFLAACTTNADATPTPFSEVSTVASRGSNPLFMVEISELAANPEGYEGSLLAVNGRYQPIIPRVCSSSQYDSPSTWGLTAGEWMAYMSGYDAQLKSLLPVETSMAVTGVWRQWRGPVGCGKDAVIQDIWYLEVQKIDSPNPLTQITLTPTIPGETSEIAEGGESPGSQEQPALSPAPFSEEVTPTNSSTNPESPGSTPASSQVTATTLATPAQGTPSVISTPTPTSTSAGGGENESALETAAAANTTAPTSTPNPLMSATPTSNSSGTGTSSTPRPTANSSGTGTPSTPRPTSISSGTGTPSTPQPTANPLATATPIRPPTIVPKGPIDANDFSEVAFAFLGANEIHEWELVVFELIEGATFTVNIASDPGIDTIISVLKGDTIIIDQQNLSSPDEIEVAILDNLPEGEYRIQIETVDNIPGDYAVAIQSDASFFYSMSIKDILVDGDSVTSTVEEEDEDFWFFYAEEGDAVTITLTPLNNSDEDEPEMYLALYNNDFNPDLPIKDTDFGSPGAAKIISNEIIPQDGVYMIQASDEDYDGNDYELALTIE